MDNIQEYSEMSTNNEQDYSETSTYNQTSCESDEKKSNIERYQAFSQEVEGVSDIHPTKPQLPESQFLKKVDKIPVVHNIWISLLARYSLIKDTHPIVKGTMEFGENAAYWAEQKVEYLVTVTKMDEPLKKIDTAALNGVVKIENTQNNVRNRFQKANKVVKTKIEDTTNKVNKGTEWVRFSVFVPTHTVLDFVEKKCEAVMLKPSSENSKASTGPGLVDTVSRLVDVTYRFNAGMFGFVRQKVTDVTDKKNWENFYVARIQPHTPSKVRIRQSIIYQEISKELKREIGGGGGNIDFSYQENKELLEVDRKIINLGRAAVCKSKAIKQDIERLPSRAWDFGANCFSYTKEALSHLSEARSLRDLAGIGLYEIRGVLMGAQDSFVVLRKSALLDGTISWMASQEKFLSNTI